MTISAKVIEDSVNCKGVRLTTLQLEFPRYILPQFNTHRVFSRNAASSRAIPTKKIIENVVNNPVIPIYWGVNKKGMQATEEMPLKFRMSSEAQWLEARDRVLACVNKMLEQDVKPHKQVINRLLEPWMHAQVVVSATDWDNFFELRDHEDAQQEIAILAREIREARESSVPKERLSSEWHIPYITDEDRSNYDIVTLLKISTARCARVSYLLHDGKLSNPEKDIELHDRLVVAEPKHSSPAEHIAMAVDNTKPFYNFRGWKQYRWFLDG